MSAWKDAPELGAYAAQHNTDDDDEIFAELEAEVEALNEADADDAAAAVGGSGRDAKGDLASAFHEFRAQRLAEIEAAVAAHRGADDTGRGKYHGVRDEKELLRTSYKEPRVVIHFAHKEFRRCHILDRHLEHLARQHPNTLFLKADVKDTPFLVEKLGIQVLPCLLAFVSGVCKERFVGFEEFGNADNFTTAALEWRLGRVGVITPQQTASKPILGFGVPQKQDAVDDWDD
ncbi:uncharacterized protein MJAP1_000772 [Malassezia japonica]|uniref:Thioredoxin-like protein n=1 Tax=Malassezia japonica TaxID=223818 RepID=A0AAF0EVT7_9BASI|nr:uncharacterized protein MJAP1_000772 [Malassezia japonica]WFD37825.1 hypothetical protein MJAP1_000772 [Malassezia japonica]